MSLLFRNKVIIYTYAEWDLRMAKIKQHISGTFRGEEDVHVFVSCAASSQRSKNRRNAYGILSSIAGRPSFIVYCLLSPRHDRGFSSRENALFVLLSSKLAMMGSIVTDILLSS